MNNDQIIKDLGIENLPKEQQDAILLRVAKTLDLRIGMALADNLSDDKLAEFQALTEKGNEAEIRAWLEANYPNYHNVAAEELAKLKTEITKMVQEM
jgi:hypothetical protein